jgi:hypothetical protein
MVPAPPLGGGFVAGSPLTHYRFGVLVRWLPVFALWESDFWDEVTLGRFCHLDHICEGSEVCVRLLELPGDGYFHFRVVTAEAFKCEENPELEPFNFSYAVVATRECHEVLTGGLIVGVEALAVFEWDELVFGCMAEDRRDLRSGIVDIDRGNACDAEVGGLDDLFLNEPHRRADKKVGDMLLRRYGRAHIGN